MSNLREALDALTARARDLGEHVRGDEQATKMSLIGALFTMLGYDLTLKDQRASSGGQAADPDAIAASHRGSHVV